MKKSVKTEQRLNNTGIDVDISTFSKASSHRSLKPLQEIYHKLNEVVNKRTRNKYKPTFRTLTVTSGHYCSETVQKAIHKE